MPHRAEPRILMGMEVNDVEKLVGDQLRHESWDEYADHSLTGDNQVEVIVDPPGFASDTWWGRLATWTHVCKPCREYRHKACTGDCDCALNGHKNPGAS